MTAQELIHHFNSIPNFYDNYTTYEVNAITYANCCQFVFNKMLESEKQNIKDTEAMYDDYKYHGKYYTLDIAVGLNGGLKFKNIELILKT